MVQGQGELLKTLMSQGREDILPVATLIVMLHVLL